MPLIRKFAVQGHAIPSGAHSPRGPFPPEIFAQNPRAEDEYPHSDSLHEALDDVRMFRCRYCEDVLYEDELDNHDCNQEEE
jgi:hypothetical protein